MLPSYRCAGLENIWRNIALLFYAIKFLKLNKIEKVFEIKSQIVQLKLNHKPTGAWACLSFSKKSGKISLIQQEILKAHNCMSISIVKIP